MKVLGIDPSLRNFGLAIATLDLKTMKYTVNSLALVETEADNKNKQVRKNSTDLERCRVIFREMTDALQGVELVFCEVPVGSQSARAMASYGFCLGLLASIQTPLIQVTPSEVKMAATGDKNATKDEMIQWAVGAHPDAGWLRRGKSLIGKNEHLADAVASIEAGLRSDQFKQARAIMSWTAEKAAA